LQFPVRIKHKPTSHVVNTFLSAVDNLYTDQFRDITEGEGSSP